MISISTCKHETLFAIECGTCDQGHPYVRLLILQRPPKKQLHLTKTTWFTIKLCSRNYRKHGIPRMLGQHDSPISGVIIHSAIRQFQRHLQLQRIICWSQESATKNKLTCHFLCATQIPIPGIHKNPCRESRKVLRFALELHQQHRHWATSWMVEESHTEHLPWPTFGSHWVVWRVGKLRYPRVEVRG